jgi:hypothetical protein
MPKFCLIFIIILFNNPIFSSETSSVSFKSVMGYPLLTFNAGELYKGEPLKAKIYIRPELHINMNAYNIAFIGYFQGALLSTYGMLPYTGFGVGALYYPDAFAINKSTFDLDSSVVKKKLAPYIGFNIGLSRLSVSDIIQQKSFSAILIDLKAVLGFDYPLTNSWSFGLDLSLISTLLGNRSSDTGKVASVNGMILSVNISFFPD